MIWVTAALAVVVAILTVFVLGLLRSHAELLRRTAELDGSDRPPGGGLDALPDGVVPAQTEVSQTAIEAIEGVDCELEPFRLDVRALDTEYLLVAFLSTTCFSCLDIWRDIIEEGEEARTVEAGDDAATLVIALKGREHENLGKAQALAAETAIPVVMSGDAWSTLEVPGSPYFALIATKDRRVVGAGSAQAWHQLRSLASDGMLELSAEARRSPNGRRGGYRSIIEREDDDLARAGIHPGHPSLTAPLVKADPSDTGDGAP